MDPAQVSICVFCGSRDGVHPGYRQAAQEFGTAMAAEGWRLVYGAGDIGLMGAVAEAAQAAGGDTFGVIPVHLLSREVARRNLQSFIVTENMHERKKVMYMNSDAIVVLPGGAGSLDEFFEVLTWRQLALHAKPIFLLNTNGYWNKLISLVDHVISEGFADQSLRTYVGVVDEVPELVAALRNDLS
ncbi:MAG: TIGR00730 family Rossman fold protein [Rhodobacter sp.]|nr:TIGR00730 family Rossman fold protein [Rhodobacter sp.]